MMGSPESEIGHMDSESPQRLVHISSFAIGKFPVTQMQWRVVSRLPKVSIDLPENPSDFIGDYLPVEQISWYEAVEFCDRLQRLTGREYRLPSEAEWEYASRAGTTTPFFCGDTITRELANFQDRSAYENESRLSKVRGQGTTAVETYPPNAFGLYDMHGNVLEWCFDQFHPNYDGAPVDGTPWTSSKEPLMPVLRGGAWNHDLWECRSAKRYGGNPKMRVNFVGFRVACSLS